MKSVLLFVAVVLVASATLEFVVLTWWYGRWRLGACIAGVAAFIGLCSVECAFLLSAPGRGAALDAFDIAWGVALVLVYGVAAAAVALIPASIVAVVFRKMRRKT
jgi:hypothetical protein